MYIARFNDICNSSATKAQRRDMNYKTSRLTSGGQVSKREESIAEKL